MTPLERRYRRLIWLLPAQYRAARGEELLSLLLDLDSDRTRPRPAEVLSLVALALRLRLAAVTVPARIPATVALTALLIAWGTEGAGQTLDAYTEAVLRNDLPAFRADWPYHVLSAGLPLACAVAWIVGARWVALIPFATMSGAGCYELVSDPASRDPGFLLVFLYPWFVQMLTMLGLLVLAAYRRWPVPGARWVWLASTAVAIVVWKGTGVWDLPGVYYDFLYVPVALVLVGIGCAAATGSAAAAAALAQRRGWWIAGVVAGVAFAVGWLVAGVFLSAMLGQHLHGDAGLLAVVIGLLAAAAYGLTRLRRRPTEEPPPAPAHRNG